MRDWLGMTLRDFKVVDNREFTFHLRPGHRWSDGHPFTSADFEYWWNDVCLHPELSPSGPPSILLVDGQPPAVTFRSGASTVYFQTSTLS